MRHTKNLTVAAALALAAAACSTTQIASATATLSSVLAEAKSICGFVVVASDWGPVQALINLSPTGTAASALGNSICNGILAATPPAPGATAYSVVNGVTIRGHFTAASLRRATGRRGG